MPVSEFTVKFSAIEGAPNIIYLDDDGNTMNEAQFKKELQTGYRAALLLIPVANAIQLQVGMMTPYHKNHYELDPQFVVENYNEYLRKQQAEDLILTNEDEFQIGEII